MSKEIVAGGCCCCWSVLGLITFCVIISAYTHLGPDEQVLIKTAAGKKVINGPNTGTQLNPFQRREKRKATILDPMQYAIVQDQMTAIVRSEAGPQLLFLRPNDAIISINQKLVLQKDEYVRLVDRLTGVERVERGPNTIVPSPTETSDDGVQKAIAINVGNAVEVREKTTGARTLITTCDYDAGVFVPLPTQDIVAVRSLIHVLPHEAMIVRDVAGKMTVYSGREVNPDLPGQCVAEGVGGAGGTAFFLPPYSKIVRMTWSSYPNPAEVQQSDDIPGDAEDGATVTVDDNGRRLAALDSSLYVDQDSGPTSGSKKIVTTIDLRTQKSFYTYEVRTSDNVKLEVSGTIFWQIEDVRKMIVMTADPEGDVWARSRSILTSAISETDLGTFMNRAAELVQEAFENQTDDTFFSNRGLVLVNTEMTKYEPVDDHTKDTLESIIRTTVTRINELQKQRSKNDVQLEKLNADILLEKNKTVLIEVQAENSRILAQTAGATDGGKVASSIASFVHGLNQSLPNASDRVDLFKHHRILESTKADTSNLASGSASLYLAPKDLELRLSLPQTHDEL